MLKRITIISLDPKAGDFYQNLVQRLFKDIAEVDYYSVNDGTYLKAPNTSDIYMVSTDAFSKVEDARKYIGENAIIVEIYLAYSREIISKLEGIPEGKKVLFVNFTEKMTREALTLLDQYGISNIEFIPYYPGSKITEEYDLVVTPGEYSSIPDEALNKEIIDIGHRYISSPTMIEVALKLDLEEMIGEEIFKKYIDSVVINNYSFFQSLSKSKKLESYMAILTESLDEGVIGIGGSGKIFSYNDKAAVLTNVEKEQVMDTHFEEYFPYIPFLQCIAEKKKIDSRIINVAGNNLAIRVSPIFSEGEFIGAFAFLQSYIETENLQQNLRSQLFEKQLTAKYSFDDIKGDSKEMKKMIKMLKKMSNSKFPVLLTGETGTGKELYANAIHNASERRNSPFLAINCAAIPENLLESELFGYEDGAFTGASKGGKLGYFEHAHTGTIFLDELEATSLALQVKLLRVLQEKEIMRVGGRKIIKVDVRIIAATNENLNTLIEEEKFRKDLYYRLSVLPIEIPPLRCREGDVEILIDYFKKQYNLNFQFSSDAASLLQGYDWPGNVRELQNLVEYLSFVDKKIVNVEDLPVTITNSKKSKPTSIHIQNKEDFILQLIYAENLNNIGAGRDTIIKRAMELGEYLSQVEVRNYIRILKEKELITNSKGRGGSRLTKKGYDHLNHLNH